MRDHAHEVPVAVHDGQADEVIVPQQPGHFGLVGIEIDGENLTLCDHLRYESAFFGEHQLAQGDDALQRVLFVHDIDVVGHLLFFKLCAYEMDGLVNGGILRDGDDVGVHHAGGGVRIEAQQHAQLFRVIGGKIVEQHLAMAGLHFIQDVHGVVGVHFGEEAGGVIGIHVFQKVAGVFLVQLGKGVGGFLCRQMREHAKLLVQRQLLQMLGTVGWMDEILILDIAPALGKDSFILYRFSRILCGSGRSIFL